MKTISTVYLLALSLMSLATVAQGKAVVTSFPGIKLTPENVITPLVVPAKFTFGMADVSVDYDASRGNKWRACATTHIEGFIPGLLQIHTGEIFENGDIVVDFSDLLTDHHDDFHGCLGISETLYKQMIGEPEKFYLEAHVGSEPANFAKKTIRGQLVQKFTATLTGSNEVSPFKGAKNTSGKATVSFEDAGKVACFDASFFKTSTSSSVPASSFVYADVHFGDKGKNGEIVLKFTPTRVSDERFYGCLTLKELGAVGVQVIADILADPVSYYVHAHVGKTGTDDFNVAIRGQLEYYK